MLPWLRRNTGSKLREGTEPTGAGEHKIASLSSNRASPQTGKHPCRARLNPINAAAGDGLEPCTRSSLDIPDSIDTIG